MRFFNTAGPCRPEKHYMLPAAARLADENIPRLIQQEAYFVVHAPRQTGKTTAMIELAQALTASGNYVALLVSMEVGAGFPNNIEPAEKAILDSWRADADFYLSPELRPPVWSDTPAGQRIGSALEEWSRAAPRPLVIFLDEIDALQDDVLISVLRQLRDGYRRRPTAFPASLALIGLRDVRDYKVASGGSERLTTSSPFNIAVRSITLRNFTAQEVHSLLEQHTTETCQEFTSDALNLVFELTQGQPWLVNALAKVVVEELVTDLTQPIEAIHIETAKELLIARRQTHLDQLTDKLRQLRVRRVIEPILAGGLLSDIPQDDRDYVIDLGAVRRRNGGSLEIANPIYREIIPRSLASTAQDSLPPIQPIWRREDGTLDTDKLLEAFLAFWRQHGQPLLRTAHYHEIAPHLVMMAFLDRVVNGGGIIDREYAIGSDRMDLHLRYRTTRLAIELKVWRDGKVDPLQKGLQQLDDYMSGLGLETGWLVIFDQRSDLPDISERTTTETAATSAGRIVTVIRA
ncbi:AAA-like domain-containing protein [Chloroflexi bacterium TSY]|nr:AAA-like domain-containing protein [Chloroflexi bacterium TSY]